MALDINVNNNINVNSNIAAAKAPNVSDNKAKGVTDAVADAAKKAVEAMGDVTASPAKKEIEISDEKAAISETSEQGDELKVTKEGADSAKAGATVINNNEDGLVAKQNEASIEANEDAMESMRAQIQETKENQARAMEQMKETAQVNAERAKERNELRDASNEDAEARKDLIIEEATGKGNSVVETAKEQVDNLTGLTEAQVEKLYRDGRISRYEYQQNMEAREAADRQADEAAKENSQVVKETLAGEAVAAASEALVTAVDNGNQAVMEAALGIGKEQDPVVQAITR